MWAFTVVLVVGLKSACLICSFEDPWFPGLWERRAQVREHQTIGLRVAHSSTCGQERVLSQASAEMRATQRLWPLKVISCGFSPPEQRAGSQGLLVLLYARCHNALSTCSEVQTRFIGLQLGFGVPARG